MIIRLADPDRDAVECAVIYTPFVLSEATSMEEVPPPPNRIAERMRELAPTHPWLVAEIGGRVAGFAYASPHRRRPAYRWAVDLSLYVHPDHHGDGVGRTLQRHVLSRLREQGYRTAHATIALPNDPSVRLHESLGFRAVARYPNVAYKAGAWRDVGVWQFDLAPDTDGIPAEPSGPAP
jgi:phosphinothricin acetyltransferase